MENTPFFSIVIPIYNSENYLQDTVESILHQDFADFQVVLVDDCSADASREICTALQEKDARVQTVFLDENGGASHARTVGLQAANGKYILFMDADDTLCDNLFSKAYAEASVFSPDVIMFDAEEVYLHADGTEYNRVAVSYPQKRLSTPLAVQKEVISIEKTTLFGYLWNKFYAVDLLQRAHVSFADMPLNEDFKFNIDIFPSVTSLSALGVCGYRYFKRDNQSLTSRFVENYFELQTMRIKYLLDFHTQLNICSDAVWEALCAIYVRSVYSALQRNMDARANMQRKAQKNWLTAQYQSDLYRELLPHAKPEGKLQAVMSNALQKKNTVLVFFIARAVYLVKEKFPVLFSKLKQNR